MRVSVESWRRRCLVCVTGCLNQVCFLVRADDVGQVRVGCCEFDAGGASMCKLVAVTELSAPLWILDYVVCGRGVAALRCAAAGNNEVDEVVCVGL